MTYALGVDLGTTYTAAAVSRDGRPEMVTLGERTPSVPSVVFVGGDEEILVGQAAERRGVSDPDRVAREFKRRFGDPTPLVLGESAYSVERLSARLLRWVHGTVAEREGEKPSRVTVTHPANWGPVRQELFEQVLQIAELEAPLLLPEPVAAAIQHAGHRQLAAGTALAVYDLGGGTFDAAVVVAGDEGKFAIVGEPGGIEHLGGIDFDAAVLAHVVSFTNGAADQLDPDDPVAAAALAQLQSACVSAKEALSSDTEVQIPVLLPNWQGNVRLTRSEFEQMIRPAIEDSTQALLRVVSSAAMEPDELDGVLLVGGSSRIPLVSQLVRYAVPAEVVSTDPEHAIALGAARHADLAAGGVSAHDPARKVIPFPRRQSVAPVDETDDGAGAQEESALIEPTPAPAPTPLPVPRRTRRSARRFGGAAAACALAALAVAAWSPGGGPMAPEPAAGAVQVAGVDPNVSTPKIALAQPIPVRARGEGRPTAELSFGVLGIPLGGSNSVRLDRNGQAELNATSARWIIPGPVDAKLELTDGDSTSEYGFAVARNGSGWLTLPAGALLVLVLAVAAFAESFLGTVRRTGEAGLATLAGMALVGLGFGLAVVLGAWVAGIAAPSIASVALGAALGATAGVMSAIALKLRRQERMRKPA
ncbi:Hsp70 family protein [Motilibacter deserti]|uniref:Hsp70 family protein n=1 Tax=Motilibacter deserti TaxID=2714956 RepID=A0ABX0GSF7_9ACTN|nr:Hsp70 family protein [Motilibacter deserti]